MDADINWQRALENKRDLDRLERAAGNPNPVFAYTDGLPAPKRRRSSYYFTREERFYIREAVSKARDLKAAFAFLRGQFERGAHLVYAVKLLRKLTEQGAV